MLRINFQVMNGPMIRFAGYVSPFVKRHLHNLRFQDLIPDLYVNLTAFL
jgi:hypothetical protein